MRRTKLKIHIDITWGTLSTKTATLATSLASSSGIQISTKMLPTFRKHTFPQSTQKQTAFESGRIFLRLGDHYKDGVGRLDVRWGYCALCISCSAGPSASCGLASVVDGGERVGRWEETACYYTLEASLEVEEKPRTVFIGRWRVPKRRRCFLTACCQCRCRAGAAASVAGAGASGQLPGRRVARADPVPKIARVAILASCRQAWELAPPPLLLSEKM